MIAIPTFKVGEKVRLHFRPYEMLCPECGTPVVLLDYKPFIEEARIMTTPELIEVGTCHHIIPTPEGFYHVGFDTRHVAVPYTLLEKLEKE